MISPLIVHCINTNQKPAWHHYASIDALQDYVNQPIIKAKASQETIKAKTTFSIADTSYFKLFYLLFCLLILFRSYQTTLNLGSLRTVLAEAIPYKTSGKGLVKIYGCFSLFIIKLRNICGD